MSHNLGPSLKSKGYLMDIESVVAQLRHEASRIHQAIAALTGLSQPARRRGRPPKASQVVQVTGRKRRHFSAAARARISAAMKERWAKRKSAAAPTKAKAAQKKAAGRKPMSPAMRKKLSAMMKARWAERKKGT